MKTNNKMKIKNKLIITSAILFVFGAMTACGTKTEPKNGAANEPVVQTANKTNNAKPPENIKTEVEKPADAPASPTEVYKAAFVARQKKDLDGLKKVLSKKMLDFFTDMGETENKTLDDELKQLAAQPQASTAEVRSEKITGDQAALEYRDENGKWQTMDFVKEDGAWKLIMPDAPPMNVENKTGKRK